MVIVTGTYLIKPGKRDEFLKAIYDQGIYAEFIKEKGNISYDYYYPHNNDNDIFFFERWEDMDSWEAHKKAPHTQKLQPIKDEFMTGFTPGVAAEVNL